MRTSDLERWTEGGRWVPHPPPDREITHIATDSRRLFQASSCLFVCIRGPRHDGHRYIVEAAAGGVTLFIAERLPEEPVAGAHFLLVPDSLRALQALAGHHRRQFRYPFVAITGSNGKTTVKEWLYTLLHEDRPVVRSPRSYNSQLGVALSLSLAGGEHDIALIEAGISQPGEMAHLERMVRPDIGILTSLGSAHDEGFPDRDTKLREKLLLFEGAEQVIVPQSLVDTHPAAFASLAGRLRTWAEGGPATLEVIVVEKAPDHQDITYRYAGHSGTYRIPFPDEAARQNSLTCLLFCLELGLPAETLHERLSRLPALTMRLETREGWNNNLIINDFYNADLEALRIALDFFNQRKGRLSGWVILSDLDETGLDRQTIAGKMAALLQDVDYERLTCIGETGSLLEPLLPSGRRFERFADTGSFLAGTDLGSVHHTAILLKGARRFAFEDISRKLVRFVHRTRLEVHLGALSHNLLQYTRLLQPDTRILVMVKASAYGGGSAEIARWLAFQRVHWLGVAYVDEGVELRRAGIRLPILVMNPDESAFPLILEHDLEPEIHSMHQFRQFVHFLAPGDPEVRIHVKLETGMNRLGFTADDLPDLLRIVRDTPQIRVASVMSHLSASDDPGGDSFTRRQAERFQGLADAISAGLGYRPLRHLLNSSGIRRFPEYQFEMVRLGIGLYGLDQAPGAQDGLLPALALRTRVTRVHRVSAGESVGYGRRGAASHDRTIATIDIGYADGLLRLAGEGRFAVRIHGHEAPTVGSICMDMAMVDVSHIPDCRPGDEVTLFDADKPIAQLARVLQTIPYEVLTNISSRVPRIYFDE